MIKAKCQLLGLVQLEVARPDHAPPAIGLWLRCSNLGNQTLSDPPTVRKCRNWEIFNDDNMRKIIFLAVFQALCSMQCLIPSSQQPYKYYYLQFTDVETGPPGEQRLMAKSCAPRVKLTQLLRLSVSTFLPGLLLRKPRALRDKA